MQVINWLELQPLLADVDMLNARLQEAQPAREVCRFLVDIILRGYPWPGRSDLIPCYHPSRTYRPGQWIALPVPSQEGSHPTIWQVAQVKQAENTGNSIQGRFQALVLDVDGKEVHKSGGIPGATYDEPRLSSFTPEEHGWMVEWVADRYAAALLSTLRKLIQKGWICGRLAGETYLPEQLFALSIDRLHPFFDRLSSALRWVSIEEMLLGLPDLSDLKPETARTLIRATLKVSPYRSLGGDRWTTAGLFDQMNRELPSGLPTSNLRSKLRLWTEQDKKDLAVYRKKPIPAEAVHVLEELGTRQLCSQPNDSAWQPPSGSIRLPALSYLHVTQAYFPVGQVLHAFAPDIQLVFVKLMDDEYQPFLLDRERGQLKAVNPESMQRTILGEGLPAGTHLWLVHQGNEKYRIIPQPLSSNRMMPCKLAHLEAGKLRLEHGHIQIKYECDPFIFKANISIQDVDAQFARAEVEGLSVRDAITSVIQELCAADPENRAHRSDIFNAVFLKRLCSPDSISVLLYTQPCFIRMQGDYFRYKSVPDRQAADLWKQTNRAAQLWEELVMYCVPPDPMGRVRTTLGVYAGLENPISSMYASPVAPSLLLDTPESLVCSPVPDNTGGDEWGEITLKEKINIEVTHILGYLTEPLDAESVTTQAPDKHDLLPDDQQELEKADLRAPVMDAGSMSRPTWIKVSMSEEQPASTIDTRRMAYGLKIPARPLHKRPMYQRVLFCVRGWIHGISGRNHDQAPR